MRVTFIGLNYVPETTGISVYTAGAAEGLAARGHQVTAVVGYPHYPAWKIAPGHGGVPRRATVRGVAVTRRRHPVPRNPALLNRSVMEAVFGAGAASAPWARPDLVVLVTPALFSSVIAGLRARVAGTPAVAWVQDIYSLGVAQSGTGGAVSARAARAIEGRFLRSMAGVIVIHERFKRYLVDELGVKPERITVVRNWTHVTRADPSQRAAVRARLGWRADETIVLHAGNMGAKQALESVVEASRLAAQRSSPVRFVLLGDGNRRQALQALEGNDRLSFLAPLPDGEFESALAAADILLINERRGLTEMSVPSKLTSYFSTGLPVIAATDATSVTGEEILTTGAGLRVDAEDPAALLDGVERLAGDPALAERLGRAGVAFMASELSADTGIASIEAALAAQAARTRRYSTEPAPESLQSQK